MWSPLADSPPRSVAPSATSSQPPVGEVRRDLDADVGHQPRAPRATSALHVVERRPAVAHSGSARARAASRSAGAPVAARRPRVGDLGRLLAVVAAVRDEVLEDHLLQVAVLGVDLGQRLQRGDALLRASRRCPTRIPLVNGMRSSPAARIVSSRAAGCLVGEPWWTTRSRVDRLEHQPLRRGHLAQPREVLARQHAEVRVRQQPALQRALAGPDHVGVKSSCPNSRSRSRDLGLTSGFSPVSTSSSLTAAPRGVVEQPLDLVGRVQVRLVRGERAVLAVALARPRQREREVAEKVTRRRMGPESRQRGVPAGTNDRHRGGGPGPRGDKHPALSTHTVP